LNFEGRLQDEMSTKRVTRLTGGLFLFAVLGAAPARAQLKAGLVEDPKVGSDAPDFSLSYLTAEGPGPADQPFRLRAELGRTVVLLFATSRDDSTMRREWQALAAARDSAFGPGTVVVGLVRWKAEPTQSLAASLGSTIKFLPDSVGRGFRSFNVGRRESLWVAYVIDPEGRVAYRTRSFLPSNPQGLSALSSAARLEHR
jgi:peroxiredoxin